jgi:hypothetical protein
MHGLDLSNFTSLLVLALFTYVVEDASGNASDECIYYVSVYDDDAPELTAGSCPQDQTVANEPSRYVYYLRRYVPTNCEGEATWDHPTYTDNCVVDLVTITFEYFGDDTVLDSTDQITWVQNGTSAMTSAGQQTWTFPKGFNTVTYRSF